MQTPFTIKWTDGKTTGEKSNKHNQILLNNKGVTANKTNTLPSAHGVIKPVLSGKHRLKNNGHKTQRLRGQKPSIIKGKVVGKSKPIGSRRQIARPKDSLPTG